LYLCLFYWLKIRPYHFGGKVLFLC
jgi:hypothetical protein